MFATLKAEFRKLFTVRSTYLIVGLSALIVIFFTFYIEGLRAGDSAKMATKLASEVPGAIGAVSLLGALVGVLLMTHEYRYNTIMYTLTAARRRTRVLLAKIAAVSTFAVLFTLFIAVLSPAMAYLGMHIKGLDIAPQQFPWVDLLWQALFYGWAYSMVGLLFAALFRSQVGAIVALFFAPTIEHIASLLLKENSKYLPFNALGQVLQAGAAGRPDGLTTMHAALVISIYLLVGWLIAWILFVRRDAN
jgi:ABC-type transport system involved in multi-copper enzyme maturation permease subunit